jgi:hypothetical protein
VNAYTSNRPEVFFVDGPGGTGKTFLENLLLATVRAKGDIALAVASSGITSILLDGGRTAHSRFKIPLNITRDSFCSISAQSSLASLLRAVSLIVWDEAPMQHRYCFEAVDRTLKDLRKDDRWFGGITVVFAGQFLKLDFYTALSLCAHVIFSGDFRQCLPVVPKGSRPQIVNSSLIKSPFFASLIHLPLTINMRLLGGNMTPEYRIQAEEFAAWLLKAGEGLTDGDELGCIRLPPNLCLPPSAQAGEAMHALILSVNPAIQTLNPTVTDISLYFRDRAILSPRNIDVDLLNDTLLRLLPGEEKIYHSADKVAEDEDGAAANMHPIEYLNSITIPGMPLHKAVFKIGCPIMLLRNLDPANGMCNGTRLLVTRMAERVLEAKILSGSYAGKDVFIPSIGLDSNSPDLHFTMRRFQFPVRLAFAMTINKAQGQSLGYVGVDLSTAVFAHGQLYVALSRATNFNNVKALLDNSEAGRKRETKNVVYTEVFRRQ